MGAVCMFQQITGRCSFQQKRKAATSALGRLFNAVEEFVRQCALNEAASNFSPTSSTLTKISLLIPLLFSRVKPPSVRLQ